MKTLDVIAAVLLVVGGLNWGLVSVAHFDLVAAIFGMKFAKLPHSVPSSTLWLAWRRCTRLPLSRPFSIAGDTSRLRLVLVKRKILEDWGERFRVLSYFTWDENPNTQSRSPHHRADIRSAESRRRVRSLLDAARPASIG